MTDENRAIKAMQLRTEGHTYGQIARALKYENETEAAEEIGAYMSKVMETRKVFAVAMGDRIRTARKAAGLNMKSVASALGVSVPAVSHWEIGDNLVSLELLAPLAGLIKADVRYLLTGEGKSNG